MMELVVASVVIAMIGWSWLFLHLFLLRVTAEIDAVRDSPVAKLDAREHRLGGKMQRLEDRLEGRMQRLEDGQNSLRVELARLEASWSVAVDWAIGGEQVRHRTCDDRRPLGERVGDPVSNPNHLCCAFMPLLSSPLCDSRYCVTLW